VEGGQLPYYPVMYHTGGRPCFVLASTVSVQ
jgi:hypothetical protein